MREYRVIDAWKPRGKNAGNGSISSGGTVNRTEELMEEQAYKMVGASCHKLAFHPSGAVILLDTSYNENQRQS